MFLYFFKLIFKNSIQFSGFDTEIIFFPEFSPEYHIAYDILNNVVFADNRAAAAVDKSNLVGNHTIKCSFLQSAYVLLPL